MPNSLSLSFPIQLFFVVFVISIIVSVMIFFFLEGCDVRVLEKPPGGYFTYEEIKEASSFVFS